MSGASSIEWTDATWNPVRGCSRVSEGCRHCYAERVAARFSGVKPKLDEDGTNMGEVTRGQFYGYAEQTKAGPRWTGRVQLVPSALDWPLRKRKPLRIFVNSMSDLFHERLSDEDIAAVFGVMAACPQHTFQVLTKRPERAREVLGRLRLAECLLRAALKLGDDGFSRWRRSNVSPPWPLPNVWLGTSVEDQATADERIPLLLQCPSAVRFVSYEPALGPVDFHRIEAPDGKHASALQGQRDGNFYEFDESLDWLIVGGESGPGARPFDLAWARAVVEQCREAGVACFVKQLGLHPRVVAGVEDISYLHGVHYKEDSIRLGEPATLDLRDRKGGDWSEWPSDLKVREFPR